MTRRWVSQLGLVWQEEVGIPHIRNSYNRYVMTAEVFLRSLYLLAPSELNDSAGRLDSNGSEGSSWKVDASISEIYWLGLGLRCPDISTAAAFCNAFSGKIKEVFYSADTAQIGGQRRARSHSLMELKVVEWLKTEWRSCDVPWKGGKNSSGQNVAKLAGNDVSLWLEVLRG